MPFLKGKAALRRTVDWLQKGDIFLRNNVRIVAFNYSPSTEKKQFPEHEGLNKFVFWHLPQLQYKNPQVQFVVFKNLTPTPWIKVYLDTDDELLIDCFERSREDIKGHVINVVGKTKEMLDLEAMEASSMTKNVANFGAEFNRQCICEIPGQVPCPGWKPLPREMRGKWKYKFRVGEITEEELKFDDTIRRKKEHDEEVD